MPVRCEGGKTLKTLRRTKGYIIMMLSNTDFAPIVFAAADSGPDELNIRGVVLGSIRIGRN
ncbi:hypothetical protein CVU37_07945 [candidate division BRC1 bacterium HGW-BRC1-1]|nr:MAG: hypothetical protein CVU37_07945 [candidate division BRC1 bacterium HGW-BRC1-1]